MFRRDGVDQREPVGESHRVRLADLKTQQPDVRGHCVPAGRFPEVVRHAREHLVAPGGRLLVSVYQPAGATAPDAAARLASTGVAVTGSAAGHGPPGTATTAWCDA